jgi:two-component system OmpR family response regulator
MVVDDHQQIRDSLSRYLEKNGLRVTTAKDAHDMDIKRASGNFDLIVLDIMMPGEDGLSACRRITSETNIPVILLTALAEETDRIVGLELGADDYLPKPFNPRELLARIKAVLRRSEKTEEFTGELRGKKVRFEHLTLLVDRQTLTDDTGKETPLTPSEFKLLAALLERPGVVLSRDQLLDLSQGTSLGPLDRKIDNQISRLRRKVEPDILRPRIIKTIRSGGYCLSVKVEVVE